MRARVVVVVATLVTLGPAGAADQRSPQAAVQPLRIDAVVTDPQGGAITGLRVSDFDLREDGVPRALEAAEFRWVPRHSTVDLLPIETRLDEERAARQPGTRVFALFLDEFHVTPGANAARAREAVSNFLDNQVFLRDLAAVIRPLDSVRSVRFTRDRALLNGSLAAFAGRQGDFTPRTPMEEEQVGRDRASVVAARDRIVTARLRDLAMRLGELDADRAALVIISEGLRADPSGPDDRRPDLQVLLQASSQFHFPIYTFNPAAGDEAMTPGGTSESAAPTLQSLATETGGLFVRANAFIAGFARVFHDTHGYYALTYRPARTDGRFHQLDIRTRAQAHVRIRTTYWARTANESSAVVSVPSAGEADPPRVLRRSPLIDAWIGVRRDHEGRGRLVVTWEPRPGQPQPPRKVAIRVRTLTATELFDGTIGPVGDNLLPTPDCAWFTVPPGRVEVDMTVLGADGKTLDTDSRDFDVPDLQLSTTPGPALLPVEIVRRRTLREFQRASVDPDATPSSARTFGRGDRLLIRVAAYDPSGVAVRVTAHLLNRAGQPVREIEPSADGLVDGMTQFALPLFLLAPGPYQIEVTGISVNGTVKERLALVVE